MAEFEAAEVGAESVGCVTCGQAAPLAADGTLAWHLRPDEPQVLPDMPCTGTGTWYYILPGCVCGRVLDECRCGAVERD